MANQYVNKVQKSDGTTIIDITDTTATAEDVAQGKYFYDSSGARTVGTSTVPSGTKSISITSNGTTTEDVTSYATASITTAVPASAVDSGTKSISTNGTHDVIGYASANVAVPNSYSAGDEGKVVSSGALVSQTSDTVTANDTYDTTLINSLTVNVSGGGGISIDDFATAAEPSGDIVISTATSIARNVFQYRNNVTSVYSESVLTINNSAFNTNTGIITINMPNVTSLSGSAVFAYSINLKEVYMPKLSGSNQTNLFQGCTKLEKVDFGFGTNINSNVFATCNKLQTLILRRTDAICALANVNAFTNTPFRGYNSLTGTVYVPSALISTYKTATNWKTMYDAGTCNFIAIEGSQYA